MMEKIEQHVQQLFEQAPRTRQVQEFEMEMITNLQDRYADLVAQGQEEQAAFHTVIAGIGDVDELICSFRQQNVLDPYNAQQARQKSAILVSSAVGLYIIGILFPLLFDLFFYYDELGFVLMICTWAAATVLLVYNTMTKPRYERMDDSIVEEFKEWKTEKNYTKAMRRSIMSLIWLGSLIIFFLLGFFANAWWIAWMIFLVAIFLCEVVRLLFVYREGGNK